MRGPIGEPSPEPGSLVSPPAASSRGSRGAVAGPPGSRAAAVPPASAGPPHPRACADAPLPEPNDTMRRVVITGLGTVNALGLDVATSYPRMLAGENGVSTIDRFDTTGIAATIAAQVDWDPVACGFDVKEQRKLDPFTMWALMASDEALKDAGFDDPRSLPEEQRMRMGTIVATGIGGITGILEQHDVMRDRGARRVSAASSPGSCRTP